MHTKTLLLIDGNSIMNRAYYGLAGRNPMQAPDKTPTGAIFAFLNMYFKFAEDIRPDYTCVCFDMKAKTFRHKIFKDYKTKRKPMPDDLAVQIPIIKDILDNMGIYRIEREGYEADDLIGTISMQACQHQWKTVILTGDKDALQLVSEITHVLLPKTIRTESIAEYYDPESIYEKYHIRPEQIIDWKSIMGDPSDQIPGVKGIGEKGALQLIINYGSLDNIYQRLDEITPKLADKLITSKEMAYLSRQLATICRDIPELNSIDDITSARPDYHSLYTIFKRLGFHTIIKRMNLSVAEKPSPDPVQQMAMKIPSVKKIKTITAEEFEKMITSSQLFHFHLTDDTKTMDHFTEEKNNNKFHDTILKALDQYPFLGTDMKESLNTPEKGFACMIALPSGELLVDFNDAWIYRVQPKDADTLLSLITEHNIRIITFDIKDYLRVYCPILSTRKISVLLYDIAIAAHLLNQFEGRPSFERIAIAVCPYEYELIFNHQSTADRKQQTLSDLQQRISTDQGESTDQEILNEYTDRIRLLPFIAYHQLCELAESNRLILALGIEMPLISILAGMEFVGFRLDESILDELNGQYELKILSTEKIIYDLAGESFNILSPKQLSGVLFERLGLPKGRKMKTGYSTDSDVLEMLADKHPIIREIIRYRQLSKLKSTFIEGLKKNIDPATKRIHTNFNQTATVSGRLSSSDPNLQNIPVKTDEGREIRKAFIAEDGYVLVDADYSQIELRLLACFSGDDVMIRAFQNHEDIHADTARDLFHLSDEPVTAAMRSIAKTINFSIVYGIGEYSLSSDLGISVAQAKEYIAGYHKKYPCVKPYFNQMIRQAKEDGYVETLCHRRRYINELKSANRNIVAFGERAAMNTPVQGSAADIIKIAMVTTHRRLLLEGIDAKIILQVHDELIIESKKNDAQKAAVILRECMESAVKLPITIKADIDIKDRWV